MTSARLLAAFLLLCSGFVCAQENRATTGSSVASAESEKAAVSGPPWSISANLEAKANVPQDPLARLEASQPPKYRNDQRQDAKTFLFPSPEDGFVISPGALADNSCFAIRSYLMARDSKHSDSTHLAGYTTCVPSRKYQLRKVVGTPEITPPTGVSK
jgi:hypothetical protein